MNIIDAVGCALELGRSSSDSIPLGQTEFVNTVRTSKAMELEYQHKNRRHKPHYNNDYNRFKKHDESEWRDPRKRKYENRRNTSYNPSNENKNNMWDVQINLIGQKETDTMIHMCSTCVLPIKSYGRLIPCKHVFCFKCAKKTEKHCPRCKEEVHRIEQCRHGTVWMCNIPSCNRTYLSQRDLQAHVNHRHSKPPPPPTLPASIDTSKPPPSLPPPLPTGICPSTVGLPTTLPVPPPPTGAAPSYIFLPGANNNPSIPPRHIGITPPEVSADLVRPSSNLITISIQDDSNQAFSQNN